MRHELSDETISELNQLLVRYRQARAAAMMARAEWFSAMQRHATSTRTPYASILSRVQNHQSQSS